MRDWFGGMELKSYKYDFTERGILGIVVSLENDGEQRFLIDYKDLNKIVEAFSRLHYKPGINPHITDRDPTTAKMTKMEIYSLSKGGPYWWSTPDLQNNGDSNGAEIYTWNLVETLDFP